MFDKLGLSLVVVGALASFHAEAQTMTNMAALQGLAPLTVLAKTAAGKAALGANYTVTGGIQTGEIRQPTLLPFTDQQQQALRDAFITDGNLADLADGLGTTLGAAYQARAHYDDRLTYTSVSPAVAALIAYANATTGAELELGEILLRQWYHGREETRVQRGYRHPHGYRRFARPIWNKLRPSRREPRRGCLRRLPAISNRAHCLVDRRIRLL